MNKNTLGTTISAALSAASAYLADKLGLLMPVMVFLLFLFVLDYVTALIRSAILVKTNPGASNAGFNSKLGMAGILKKTGYLLSIVVAMSVDLMALYVTEQFGITIPTNTFFGLLFACFWCLNELISILENLDQMDIGMPNWLMRVVTLLKTHIASTAETKVTQIENLVEKGNDSNGTTSSSATDE